MDQIKAQNLHSGVITSFLPTTTNTIMSASSDSEYECEKLKFEATQAAKRIERWKRREAEEKAEEAQKVAEIAAAAEKRRVEVAICVEKKNKGRPTKASERKRKTTRVIASESESELEIGSLNSDEEESRNRCTVCIKRDVPCIWNKVSGIIAHLIFGIDSDL